ncbi:hypothetical protein SYNPS1DRAFT_30646 [Syncephalis pseudoplumigaleata]|uniref:Uncharacterized protein n=1 Tax=Syncephalis pseudoplumigaleata TaxID=1712513 RepID=A0A4P9YUF8_9FUNG|nr:hypothetical protein SYNPS1DRAFT_30646 [Syncephalis pseudoplumigaleata]|eukprot:RKP23597.1 hypothetical protein SYNPS1DRAFT_30646 [Syncephalis pseudoplumigaleata]
MLVAAKMVVARPRLLTSWCCLASTMPCVANGFILYMAHLGCYFNCRMLMWSMGFSISIINICNGLVLLQKTYLILNRQRWIIYAVSPLLACQVAYGFLVVFFSYSLIEEQVGCVIYYEHLVMLCWLVIIMPPNALLSTVFCYTAFKQYRLYGHDAWRRLARNGMRTMCLAVSCNMLSAILVVFQIGKQYSDTFIAVEW